MKNKSQIAHYAHNREDKTFMTYKDIISLKLALEKLKSSTKN
jgi:hypothetical protein